MVISKHTRNNQHSDDSRSVSEAALDLASEQSFPASDSIAASNITRIEKIPEKVKASEDHQNSHQTKNGQ